MKTRNISQWTEEELNVLREFFENTKPADIAVRLNRSYTCVANKAASLGIKKSLQFKASINSGRILPGDSKGRESYFKAGHTPWNKGRKWDEYLTPEKQQKLSKTQFKAGQLPHNTRKDNDIRIRTDEGRKYQFIRVAKAKWVALHVFNWEKAYGPVPKDKIVVFKGSSMDCSIDNLELITRAENMRRNTLHRYPEEVRRTIQMLGALNRQINKRSDISNELTNQ